MNWTPTSWQTFPMRQQPVYGQESEYTTVLEKLKGAPPIVSVCEIEALRQQLQYVSQRQTFVIHAGSCAESFTESEKYFVDANIRLINLLSNLLLSACVQKSIPVVKIGRMAGQYAKPRSQDFEIVNGVKLAVFKGENIHSFVETAEARICDPQRLWLGYEAAYKTSINVKTAQEGIGKALRAELCQMHSVAAFDPSTVMQMLDQCFEKIPSSAMSVNLNSSTFISHEALLLGYETSLTRLDHVRKKYYNSGAHLLWVGNRTARFDEAHIEYCRGLLNPIGIKVSQDTNLDELIKIVRLINPKNERDKVLLISRFGAGHVKSFLPSMIKAIEKAGLHVLWLCDPMHGNTMKTKQGFKTRLLDDMVSEVLETYTIHKENNSYLGGLHLELTAADVTECIGGPQNIAVHQLSERYQSLCDPRLNAWQSIELVLSFVDKVNGHQHG